MVSSPPDGLSDDEDNREREATEMAYYEGFSTRPNGSVISTTDGASPADAVREGYVLSFSGFFKTFWKRQVSVTVARDACRDHFALERTFLSYLRTSLALTMVAVIIAQLFRLQHTKTPNETLGFFVLGIPLACVCIAAAIIVLLLGTCRFWRQQNAILREKVHAGGWEMNVIGITVFMVVLILFVLLVAVDSRKDAEDAA